MAIEASAGGVWVLSGADAQRWDGTQWTATPGLRIRGASYADLDVVARNDVWAVGGIERSALVVRLTGSAWKRVALPPDLSVARGVGPDGARFLRGVSAASPRDVWVVGSDYRASYSSRKPNFLGVVVHRDGTTWRRVELPRGFHAVALVDVVALSRQNVWMIGNDFAGETGVALNWNGGRWLVFRLRAPKPSTGTHLRAITASGAGDVTIVGAATTDLPDHPRNETTGLLFRWTGQRWALRRPHGSPNWIGYSAVASPSRGQTWISANSVRPLQQTDGSELFAAEQRGATTTKLALGHVVEALAATPSSVWAAGWIGTGFRNEDVDFDFKDFTPLVLRHGC